MKLGGVNVVSVHVHVSGEGSPRSLQPIKCHDHLLPEAAEH